MRMIVPVLSMLSIALSACADPCWRYDGGIAACAQRDDTAKISVDESMRIWARINGCGAPGSAEPVAREPGIVTERIRWTGCRAQTGLIRMTGGGHVWPGGWAYFGERVIGPRVAGWSANRVLLDFFRQNPMP